MKFFPIDQNIRNLGISHVEDYFGLWAVVQDRFEQLVQYVSTCDLELHVEDAKAGDAVPMTEYEVRGGVGIVSLTGTMTKRGSSLSEQGSTVRARRALRQAAQDDDVSSILLVIESPGGTVSGTQDLANDIRSIKESKRVVSYIEDIGASAAYWVASAGTEVFANESAHVGSIGTYMALADYSQAVEEKGVKVHVIKAGEFKGAGITGAPVTDEQLADFQRVVNDTNELFVNAVAKNRNMDIGRARELADGRIYLASQAKELGLIDDVRSLDKVLDDLTSATPIRKVLMSANTPEPVLQPAKATLDELRKAFPNESADFILSQLNATMDEARGAYQLVLESRLETQAKELADAKAQADALEDAEGNDPVGDLPGEGLDAPESSDDWEGLIAEEHERLSKLPGASRKSPLQIKQQALRNVHRKNPGLAASVNPALTTIYTRDQLAG